MLRTVRILLVGLVAGALIAPATLAQADHRPETLYHQQPVGSGPVEPGFPIDHVGIVFALPADADADHDHGHGDGHGVRGLQLRFRHAGVWGPWQRVPEDGAQAVGTWTGALVAGGDADAYQVRGIPAEARRARAAALNTTDGPRTVAGRRPAASARAVSTCKSRLDWGADESIRSSNRSYAPVQIMTVHHTATQNDDPDPDARIRAIYEYHVRTNGWDDIGYQALIAEDGTVYEGRWSGSDSPSCATGGGAGWEFGHQGTGADSDMVTGAHTGGYNTGNFGVALLGTLTEVAPEPAARTALVEYLTELSERHGIDPETRVAYDNGTNAATVWTISGHRDLSNTECPGGTLYADLPAVRSDVAARLAGDTEPVAGDADDVARAETAVTGTVNGTYLDTRTTDGVAQSITEVETSGKPSTRHSLLEHVWTIDVSGGAAVTLFVEAAATSSDDGDDFSFHYSTDGGATYLDAITVPAGASGVYRAALPSATVGPVQVRVTDTVRQPGARTVDTIAVDRLFVRSGDGSETAPAAPATVTAEATSATSVTVSWSDVEGEYGYEVQRRSDPATTWTGVGEVGAATTSFDDTGLTSETTYEYRVRAHNSAGASAWTLAPSVTTPAATAIDLTASAYKVKGWQRVDLAWGGATHVDVYREDGTARQHVATVEGSSYTDEIDAKGAGTSTYQVCAVASGACSDPVTVTW